MPGMTDKGLSVLVFAAYHTLVSGEVVRKVVLNDGKGHQADKQGVEEMVAAGFLEAEGERGRLTDAGEEALSALLTTIRQAQPSATR
jgi:hypothetical protein